MPSRRQFLRGVAGAAGLAALSPPKAWARAIAPARVGAASLPLPSDAPFDHVVVLMQENRSFDHFLGWLPGADGIQEGLTFTDLTGTTYPTYDLAPDFQGCGYADPDHSWEGGLVELNSGACDGFLRYPLDRAAADTFPIGFYKESAVSVLGALARNYTTCDRYFASILAETYPNRFYQHCARTDRDHNMDITQTTMSPTIWDRLADATLSATYYFSEAPFLALWGLKYASIMKTSTHFFEDALAGTLPNVSFIDATNFPESNGVTTDDHPHADIRAGETWISSIYQAIRNSPNWSKTVLVINYDEWGGFYDHVVPPLVTDDTVKAALTPDGAPHPDYRQLGFRVPCVVVSPFAPAQIVHDGPYEHSSVLKMIEWRWGLEAMTARDLNARNLAEVLDFSIARTDSPNIPIVEPPGTLLCGPQSEAAHPPRAISGPGASATGTNATSGAGGGHLPATGAESALLVAGAAAGAALAARQLTKK